MPTEMLHEHGRTATGPARTSIALPDEGEERTRTHLERVRRLKRHLAAFVLGMVVLTPLWGFAEYETHGGFERFSSNGHHGDWKPWILYIAIGWGLWVAFAALRVRFDRLIGEAEIEREMRRLESRG